MRLALDLDLPDGGVRPSRVGHAEESHEGRPHPPVAHARARRRPDLGLTRQIGERLDR